MDAAAFQAGLNWRQQGEQKKERAKAEATETQSLRKLMAIYDPENKDQYTAMGLGDLRGSAQAIAVRQHMDKLAREEQDRAAEQNFIQLMGRVPGGTGPVAPVTSDRIMSAAAQTGHRLPPQLLTQMMREEDDTNWADIMPRPFEVGGVKGVVGKSGQFQFLPPTVGDSMQAIPVLDEEGNVLGFRVPTAKGGTAPISKPSVKTLPEAYNSRLNLLQEQIDTAERTLGLSDAELKKLYQTPDPAKLRAAKQADLAKTRQALADHVARFKAQGYGDADFWKGEEQRLNRTGAASAASAPGNYPKARNPRTGETLIYKDGQWQKE